MQSESDTGPDSEPQSVVDNSEAPADETPCIGRAERLSGVYRHLVETGFDNVQATEPAISVVVVTFQTSRNAFDSVLTAIEAQTDDAFELVVVNNGVDWDIESRLRDLDCGTAYVELIRNCGVTIARNLGAELALSDLLLFLDDDAVPEENFVAAHRCAHDDSDVVAVRGRIFPQSKTFYNRLQRWYDLGDRTLPYLLNIEGNTSIDREAYRSVSGFDEKLGGRAGHEGIDLTYRLIRTGYDRDQIVYCPDAVIYHDYATSLSGYIRKRIVSRRYRKRLTNRRPELFEFARTYSPPDDVTRNKSPLDHLVHLALDGVIRLGCRAVEVRDTIRSQFLNG
ncbi:glycosyltransferase family 2 protein [Halogeometricum borinquense]|uniref:Glycosyltransferase family 2 protein n=1 Tax=Halogeometricum borinquense TaxID=60847 RepID=A0A482TCW4_9EURY|nr:glycosyltransferase [Halogeometricum borinquense]RYJ19530.1 glycosyltransferase family 2 protein [Halogeometricum borinquense]